MAVLASISGTRREEGFVLVRPLLLIGLLTLLGVTAITMVKLETE